MTNMTSPSTAPPTTDTSTEETPQGSRTIPTIPTKLSHLERDGGYLTTTEWELTHTELNQPYTTVYGIDMQTLCRVELTTIVPFALTDAAPVLSVELPGAITVMPSDWNDLTEVGQYHTDCNMEITGSGGIVIKHNLHNATAYEYPFLYPPKQVLPDTLVAYGDKYNKAIATNLKTDDVASYDHSSDPTGTNRQNHLTYFAGTTNYLSYTPYSLSEVALLPTAKPTDHLLMFGPTQTIVDSGITKTAILQKADQATTLSGYGITDAYTKQAVDANISNSTTTQVHPSLPTTNKTVIGAINELFTSASDGKALLAETITGKGVATEPVATYQTMATNIRNIQTPTESKTVTPTAAGFSVTPSAGKHLSSVVVNGSSTLTPGNIRTGVTIFGVAGGAGIVDTSSSTALSTDILAGKTAYSKGSLLTGSIPIKAAEFFTPGTADKTIASAQYLSGTQTIKGDAKLISANIKAGANIFGVAGSASVVDTSSANATAAQLLTGSTAYAKGGLLTGTMPNLGANPVVASKAATTPTHLELSTTSVGYHTSGFRLQGTLASVATALSITPEKILKGSMLCGVTGTATSDANVTAAQMLSGRIGYAHGVKITGTIPSKAAETITPGVNDKTIAASQYLSGVQTIKGDAKLVSANIKSGTSIFGVAGAASVVDTTSGTAVATEVLTGKSAWVKGALVTGTMLNVGNSSIAASNITELSGNLKLETRSNAYHTSGFNIYASLAEVATTIQLTAPKVLKGVTVCGVAGTATADATATAAQILSGQTAYVNGTKLTGTIPSLAKKAYMPTATSQIIARNQYLTGEQVIKGDADLLPENIKERVSIFNVEGTARTVEFRNNSPGRLYLNGPAESLAYIDALKISLSGELSGWVGMTPSTAQGTAVAVRGTALSNYLVTDKGYLLTLDGIIIRNAIQFSNAAASTTSALAVEPDGSFVYASHGNRVRCHRSDDMLSWEKTYGTADIDELIVCGPTLCIRVGTIVTFVHAKTGISWATHDTQVTWAAFAGYGNRLVWCASATTGRPINGRIIDDVAETMMPFTTPAQHSADITAMAMDSSQNAYAISSDGMLTKRPLVGGSTILWSCMTGAESTSISVDPLGNVYVFHRTGAITRILANGTLLNTKEPTDPALGMTVTSAFKILVIYWNRYMKSTNQKFIVEQG